MTFISNVGVWKRVWILISISALFILSSACGPSLQDVYTPKEWSAVLKKAGDWVPLPYPETIFRPGSIIEVTNTSVRWIGHLQSCGYPEGILKPIASRIPGITFKKKVSYGADAILSFKGIEAGPKYESVKTIIMDIPDHGVDYFQLLDFIAWLKKPENANISTISPVCMDKLKQPNMYLVTEAFRVSKGIYTLLDEKGAAIKLDVPHLGDLLKFQPDLKYSIQSDGKLVIEEPVYFAVRRVVQVGNDFETRGQGDLKIEKAFFKTASKK